VAHDFGSGSNRGNLNPSIILVKPYDFNRLSLCQQLTKPHANLSRVGNVRGERVRGSFVKATLRLFQLLLQIDCVHEQCN
jgi:hypothetical protein